MTRPGVDLRLASASSRPLGAPRRRRPRPHFRARGGPLAAMPPVDLDEPDLLDDLRRASAAVVDLVRGWLSRLARRPRALPAR